MNPVNRKDMLTMVDAAIEKRMAKKDLSVAGIADELNMHSQKMNRVIRSITGKGSSEYINNYRINHAKRLLIEQDMQSIASIGYMCGFEEPTNFIRFFKRHTGLTPGEYRKQQEAQEGK